MRCRHSRRIKFKAPLKGEDSPRRGEMSAQPTEWGVELARQRLRERSNHGLYRIIKIKQPLLSKKTDSLKSRKPPSLCKRRRFKLYGRVF